MYLRSDVADRAQWLDGVKPGWETLIDLGTLDIASCCDCVLGQTFAAEAEADRTDSGFDWALEHLVDFKPEDYLPDAFCNEGTQDVSRKNRAWTAEIQARLNNPIVTIVEAPAHQTAMALLEEQ